MSNVKCWVAPCSYDALGTYDATHFDGEGAGVMVVTLWPAPAPSGTRPRDASTLCRHHLIERAENALRTASQAEPAEAVA